MAFSDETYAAARKYTDEHGGGGGTSGTDNYNELKNHPSINDVELTGNKTTSDLIPIGNGLNINDEGELECSIDPGVSAELENPLTSSVSVGGVESGSTFAKGTHLENILNAILNPVLYPSFTNPSLTLAATGSKLIEKGGSLNTTFTATFNRGTINPAYGTSGYRAGAATGYKLNNGTVQSNNTWDETVTELQSSYQANVEYSDGEQPKDSTGADYDNPYPAGNINSNTIIYEFVDAMWANTAAIGTIAKLSLVSKSTKQRDMVFPAQTVANPEVFDIPASWTVTAVQVKNDLNNQFENASDQFTITDVTHNDAGGNSVNYKRYTFNMGIATGARTVRVKWS